MNLLDWMKRPRPLLGPKTPQFWGQSAIDRDKALNKAEAKRQRRCERNLKQAASRG